jgi:hypothetical protein
MRAFPLSSYALIEPDATIAREVRLDYGLVGTPIA